MKKVLFVFILLAPVLLKAQTISTIAGNSIGGFNGDGVVATAAQLHYPCGVAIDSSGNVFIADRFNSRIRKIVLSTGIISTVAGTGIEVCDTTDGIPATTEAINNLQYVTTDNAGNFYTSCNVSNIKKVNASTGLISKYISTSADYLVVDESGNLYMTDGFTRIIKRSVSTSVNSLVAGNGTNGDIGDGGSATAAELSYPHSIALDANSNLYIADQGNRIRKVNLITGIISAFAGTGSLGYSGDGFAATAAELNTPKGIAVDNIGNLYIADENNNVIRKVTATTGIITTIAGNGTAGYSGDGGIATASQLNQPVDVKIDASGNIYIADSGNGQQKLLPSH